MREEDMIRELKKRGYKIEKNPDVTYNVEIGFAGFVGVSENIQISFSIFPFNSGSLE